MTDLIGEVYNSKICFERKLLLRVLGVMVKAACMTGFCFDIYLDCSKMATEGHQRLIGKNPHFYSKLLIFLCSLSQVHECFLYFFFCLFFASQVDCKHKAHVYNVPLFEKENLKMYMFFSVVHVYKCFRYGALVEILFCLDLAHKETRLDLLRRQNCTVSISKTTICA